MIEFDFGFDAKPAQMRPQLAVAVALGDAHRLEHLDVAARRRQRDDAGLIDRGDERRRAAVHDRHFGTIDLDHGIVDAKSRAAPQAHVRSSRRPARCGRRARWRIRSPSPSEIGAQFAVRLAVGAAAQKHDAGIGFGRMQCQRGGRAGMNADAGDRDMISAASSACRRVRPSSCPRPTPYGQTTRVEYIANRWPSQREENAFRLQTGTGQRERQILIPQTSPLTPQTLPA